MFAEKLSGSCKKKQQPKSSISNEEDQSNKYLNSSKEPPIELMFKDTQNHKSEIILALKGVISNFPNNSSTNQKKLFSCLFTDSKIA